MSSATRRRFGVFTLAALLPLVTAAIALAAVHPQPGATYRGTTHEGRYRGPNLMFKVSRDGKRIIDFKNSHSRSGFYEAGYCGGIWFGQPGNVPAPMITIRPNGTFYGKRSQRFFGSRETTVVSGRFTTRNAAVGRIHYRSPGTRQISHCDFNATFSVHRS
jgi:hypothetical protein